MFCVNNSQLLSYRRRANFKLKSFIIYQYFLQGSFLKIKWIENPADTRVSTATCCHLLRGSDHWVQRILKLNGVFIFFNYWVIKATVTRDWEGIKVVSKDRF